MKKIYRTVASTMLLCGVLSGCKEEVVQAPPPPAKVTVAEPVVRAIRDFDEYTGRMAAIEEVEIRARVRGYLDSIGFKDGDVVTKGQLLFQIDPRPFEAQLKSAMAQVDQMKARRVKFKADVTRYQELVPQGAATQQDLDKAIGELGEAEAGIRAAEAAVEEAQLNLVYAKITAPIDGLTSRAILSVGNLIGSGSGGEQLMTTIVRINPIQLYFDVDQRSLQAYRKAAMEKRKEEPKSIRELNLRFQFGLASEDGFPHEGVIDFIDNKVDAATGTIMVRGEIENPKLNFRPGFFARVRVATADPYDAILVSERAIGTQQGQKYVLVLDEKNTVNFRPVQLGALQEDGLRAIRSGLAAGERVVVNGIQRARPGTVVDPEQGSMILSPATKPAATQPATGAAH